MGGRDEAAVAVEADKFIVFCRVDVGAEKINKRALRPFLSYTFGGPCPTQGRIGRWAQNR